MNDHNYITIHIYTKSIITLYIGFWGFQAPNHFKKHFDLSYENVA